MMAAHADAAVTDAAVATMSAATPPRQFAKSDYKDYPRTLAEDDLWGQVRRTVHGKPVSEEQIAMIVAQVRASLAFEPGDVLLDLACGNGALSSHFFDDVAALHGVDYSDYLIEVAQRRFVIPGRSSFAVQDAAGYVAAEPEPQRFTKVLCYGSFTFFSAEDARRVLRGLHDRFVNVRRVMIGNLPDRDRAHRFYPAGKDVTAELDDPAAQIGIWRSGPQLEALARDTGWRLELRQMPPDFYAASYRFDAILHREP